MSTDALTGRAPFDPWELFDELPACVCVAAAEERIVYANRRWQATFNPGCRDLARVQIVSPVHPDDVPATREAWQAASANGLPFARQYRIRDHNGEYRWFSVRATPTRPSDDGAWRYLCVLTDIDEEKRYAQYLAVLAEAGDIFAALGDIDAALRRIGRLIVPLAAECFVVYRPDDQGTLAASLIVHEDRECEALMDAMLRRYGNREVDELAARGATDAVLIDVTPATQIDMACDLDHLALLRRIDARAVLLVPICGRRALLGALAVHSGSRVSRRPGDAEIRLMRELAKHIAVALDNAELVADAQRAADDLRFLAHVGETMVESLDLPSRLDRFVHAVVPRLADWATVNLVRDDGSIETVAIAHRDPAKSETVERLRGPYYGNLDSRGGTPGALRHGRSTLLSGVDESFLRNHLRPETYADVVSLGADSAFVVPLATQGAVYGTLSAMRSESARPFAEKDMWLIEELARRAAVAIANARLFTHNANVADAFQQVSLPGALPALHGTTFSAFYAPGQREATVGGDWYDAFQLPGGGLVVSIGDVSGSGLSAAVVMGAVRQLIRGAAQLECDARVILDATDRALRLEFPSTMVTAFVGIVDLARGTIAYASAGHPPPLLRERHGGIRELACAGLPLGIRGDDEPPEAICDFSDGALLVLYTDGLIESTRDIVEGDRALRSALGDPRTHGAPDVARALHDTVLRDGAHDDVAILTVVLHIGA